MIQVETIKNPRKITDEEASWAGVSGRKELFKLFDKWYGSTSAIKYRNWFRVLESITVGNRQAIEFIPFQGHTEKEVGDAAFLSSWHDDTPEGRSIIRLAYERGFIPRQMNALDQAEVYEFSATTRTSGVKLPSGSTFALPKDGSDRTTGGVFSLNSSFHHYLVYIF